MQLLGLFVGAGVLLWAASVSGRIRTARVPRVRAHYRHSHAQRVGDLATVHSRRAFARPLRLAVRSSHNIQHCPQILKRHKDWQWHVPRAYHFTAQCAFSFAELAYRLSVRVLCLMCIVHCLSFARLEAIPTRIRVHIHAHMAVTRHLLLGGPIQYWGGRVKLITNTYTVREK